MNNTRTPCCYYEQYGCANCTPADYDDTSTVDSDFSNFVDSQTEFSDGTPVDIYDGEQEIYVGDIEYSLLSSVDDRTFTLTPSAHGHTVRCFVGNDEVFSVELDTFEAAFSFFRELELEASVWVIHVMRGVYLEVDPCGNLHDVTEPLRRDFIGTEEHASMDGARLDQLLTALNRWSRRTHQHTRFVAVRKSSAGDV